MDLGQKSLLGQSQEPRAPLDSGKMPWGTASRHAERECTSTNYNSEVDISLLIKAISMLKDRRSKKSTRKLTSTYLWRLFHAQLERFRILSYHEFEL